jgi:hypothetical protein
MTTLERFESKYEVMMDDRGCWEWTANRLPWGYGRIFKDGELKLAHRASYELHTGSIPNNMLVCHTCDNPSCVNPKHLFLGTDSDNTKDMILKGRNKNLRKTKCIKGHEFTDRNTKIRKTGARRCLLCQKASNDISNAKNRMGP